MPSKHPYNDRVRSMVQLCQAVQNTPHLLDQFEAFGGSRGDLDFIVDLGVKAANAGAARVSASGDAKAATAAKTQAFAALSKEDLACKNAIRAVIDLDIGLRKIGSEAAAIRLQSILDNDTEVTVTHFSAEGQKRRKVSRKRSDEARRQEIEKDANVLLGFIDEASGSSDPTFVNVVRALKSRRITRARVEKLRDDARALAGFLKNAEIKRGGSIAATASTHDHVANILKSFGAIRGILRSVAQDNPDLTNVLVRTETRR